ncbi:polymer-forming cytoskeletal protein [Dongia soli]|uniref:Polymer-forming cytoskeletal protein n=1 Tax=Dongia soli TaxID=600628 RepID=A0ABU5EE01_9PROT|nr:polymer-forming cytoskeletal protein [Dongia soli]MDY0884137.1 polymer-forming cytoskeletal protein [Dongia soli]
MFSKANKDKTNADNSRQTAKAGMLSIISADLRISGDLICQGDIQIDGQVEGDIRSGSVVIGEGAVVTGSIQSEHVRVCGKLIGQIKADNVVLEKTAHVTGDVLHHSLAIAQGAFLEGACKRLDTKSKVPGTAEPDTAKQPATAAGHQPAKQAAKQTEQQRAAS